MDTTHRPINEIYPPGTIIGERYEIISHLAQGGMANVYIATQRNMNRDVALKILSSEFSSNQGVVSRFMREAHIVGNLQHPNTVSVYDMGETPDGKLFISMELLKGISLGDRIRNGAMPAVEILPIARQVASSLQDAHRAGIIHRDLKPDNIFLTTLGVTKVLDFGIAKLRDDDNSTEKRLTRAGTAPGTPEYMSPEQARGQDLDARSDLYSLGIVMYEMLCGHPPFDEPTFLATILHHVQSPPPPLPEEVPLALRNYVINRLLAKDPNCRPDNAETFIQEIDELERKLFKPENGVIAENTEALVKAQAEIEKLRNQLAQTKKELLRSADSPVIDPSQYPSSNMQPQRLPQGGAQPDHRAPAPVGRQAQTSSGMHPMTTRQLGSGVHPHPNAPRQGRSDASFSSAPSLAPISSMQGDAGSVQNPPPHIQRAGQGRQGLAPQTSRPVQLGSGVHPHPNGTYQHPQGSGLGVHSNPNMPRPVQQGQAPSASIPRQEAPTMSANPNDPRQPQHAPAQVYSSLTAPRPVQQQPAARQNYPNAIPQGTIQVQGSLARPDPRQLNGAQQQAPRDDFGRDMVEEPLIPPPPRRLGLFPDQKPEDIIMPGPGSSAANPRVQRHADNYTQASHPRHQFNSDGYENAANKGYASKPNRSLNARDLTKRITDIELDDSDNFNAVPINALTGQRATRKSSASQSSEATFMTFCQPLIGMVGHENVAEALRFAQGIWNASILGKPAVADLLSLLADTPSMIAIADKLLNRKAKFFADHHWQIDDLRVSVDPDGSLSIDFKQI